MKRPDKMKGYKFIHRSWDTEGRWLFFISDVIDLGSDYVTKYSLFDGLKFLYEGSTVLSVYLGKERGFPINKVYSNGRINQINGKIKSI